MPHFDAPEVSRRSHWLSFPLPPYTRSDATTLTIGHFGSAGTHPHNTASSFKAAWDAGCQVFDTSIQVTADGLVVCCAPDTVTLHSGATYPIRDLTYAELMKHVTIEGSHGRRDIIPLLEQTILSYPHAQFIIDLNGIESIDPLVQVINSGHSSSHVCVTNAHDLWLEEIRDRTSPLLQRTLGWETLQEFVAAVQAGKQPDPRIHVANWVHLPSSLMHEDTTEAFVQAAHQLNMGIRVFGVNDFNQAYRLWNAGVDAVSTDTPKHMVIAAHDRRARVQAARFLDI